MDHIDITIMDPNISLDSMNVTLGSLYQDEISVEPADVIPILATATLFQLDGLIDQCASIMEETVNIETVTKYFDTATMYGSLKIQKACISWLKVNLLSHLPEHPSKLRLISIDLMATLISTPGLFVMQTEFSVYVLLRLWLYLVFHPSWDGSPQDAVLSSHRFFQVKRFSKSRLRSKLNIFSGTRRKGQAILSRDGARLELCQSVQSSQIQPPGQPSHGHGHAPQGQNRAQKVDAQSVSTSVATFVEDRPRH